MNVSITEILRKKELIELLQNGQVNGGEQKEIKAEIQSFEKLLTDKGINGIATSFLNIDIQNAMYHIHYKYVTTDMKCDDINILQNSAHPLKCPLFEEDMPNLCGAIKCHDARKYLQDLQIYMDAHTWIECENTREKVLWSQHVPYNQISLHSSYQKIQMPVYKFLTF